MASLSGPTNPFPSSFNRRPDTKPVTIPNKLKPESETGLFFEQTNSLTVTEKGTKITTRRRIDSVKLKERENRERKEEVNNKIASQKAISIILRREATKAVIEKKRGPNNSKKLLPRTVLEALHERITAFRWESALKVHYPLPVTNPLLVRTVILICLFKS